MIKNFSKLKLAAMEYSKKYAPQWFKEDSERAQAALELAFRAGAVWNEKETKNNNEKEE